jgi:hypothetical protein
LPTGQTINFELGGSYMYGKGSVIASSTTGVGGAASILGGITVLPNTNGSTALLVLGIATVTIGVTIILSFIATRIFLRVNR